MSDIRLGIIGAGYIAKEHLKVIHIMDGVCAVGITSRTILKAKKLAKTFNIENVYDNINNLINNCVLDGLMILVSANQIYNVTKTLIPINIPLFIEKPPGLIPKQTKHLVELAEKYGTKNMVGYNRRYYSIFHKGIDLIKKNGGLLGLTIEGHERIWKIIELDIPNEIRENWIFANSTHTIDLLRLFGGEIVQINALVNRVKEKYGDQFISSVKFKSGALGTYTSHWYSPGGWSVKLYGEGISVKYGPLEKGVWTNSDFVVAEIDPESVDINYKPGFYEQLRSFIMLIKSNKLDWPGQDLAGAYLTMSIAKKMIEA